VAKPPSNDNGPIPPAGGDGAAAGKESEAFEDFLRKNPTVVLSLLTGAPSLLLLAYFVQLPLLFAGLTMGLMGSVIAAASAILVNGLLAGMLAALLYAVVQALPVVVVVRQALLSRQDGGAVEWYPPGLILAQLAILSALGIVAAFVLLFDQPGGLEGVIEAFVGELLAEVGAVEAGVDATDVFGGWISLFPGLMATSWLLMTVVNAILAQALAVRFGWNRRPSPEIVTLQLPWWLWPALGGAAALALLGGSGMGFLGQAMLVVLVMPYGFLGLAVIHKLARRAPRPGLALFAIYGVILLFGWRSLLAVLVLGFVEDRAHLRRYL